MTDPLLDAENEARLLVDAAGQLETLAQERDTARELCRDAIQERDEWREAARLRTIEADEAKAELAQLAAGVRCTVHQVTVEEVGVDGDGSHPSVLLAVRGEDRLGARWRVPLPSLEAARQVGLALYRPTTVEVFIRLPEGP